MTRYQRRIMRSRWRAGQPKRAYRRVLRQANRPQRQNRWRGSRQLKDYRNRLSRTGRKAFRSGMTEANKFKLGTPERRRAVRVAKRNRSDARRGFADTYRNPYTGTSHRRVTTGNRRSERTGRRTTMAVGFGGRGAGRSGLERIQARRQRSSARRGGQRLTGDRKSPGYRHADFSRGGRRRGFIRVGNHFNTGPNAGTVRRTAQYPASSNIRGTRSTRRQMNPYERYSAQGRFAPHARDYMNPNAGATRTPFGWYQNFGAGT